MTDGDDEVSDIAHSRLEWLRVPLDIPADSTQQWVDYSVLLDARRNDKTRSKAGHRSGIRLRHFHLQPTRV
jgi:hypothetical protein